MIGSVLRLEGVSPYFQTIVGLTLAFAKASQVAIFGLQPFRLIPLGLCRWWISPR